MASISPISFNTTKWEKRLTDSQQNSDQLIVLAQELITLCSAQDAKLAHFEERKFADISKEASEFTALHEKMAKMEAENKLLMEKNAHIATLLRKSRHSRRKLQKENADTITELREQNQLLAKKSEHVTLKLRRKESQLSKMFEDGPLPIVSKSIVPDAALDRSRDREIAALRNELTILSEQIKKMSKDKPLHKEVIEQRRQIDQLSKMNTHLRSLVHKGKPYKPSGRAKFLSRIGPPLINT